MPRGRAVASSSPAALAASRTTPLQDGEIVEEAAAAGRREPASGVRPVALVALGDVDEAGVLQDRQVAAEIAVGQRASRFRSAKAILSGAP